MLEKLEAQFTKYEVARILGARALQVAMDAPLLLKISEAELEEINYNPIEIAKRELAAGVLPITVNKPMPKKKEAKLKKLTREELEDIKKKEKVKEDAAMEERAKDQASDKKVEHEEEKEEKEISEEGEIMELSNPEDEAEEAGESAGEEEGI